jgi:hypothetical protein
LNPPRAVGKVSGRKKMNHTAFFYLEIIMILAGEVLIMTAYFNYVRTGNPRAPSYYLCHFGGIALILVSVVLDWMFSN